MTTPTATEYRVILRQPHPRQAEIIACLAKRVIIRAGRRGGKTVGVAILAVQKFLEGRRVLYAAPTLEQVDRFWYEVNRALAEPVDAKVFYKNEVEHVIEKPRTENRIRAKTAWNANTLRGDYADLLILDEWQLMAEDTWEDVGAPMLLDNNGDVVFIYTPPSLKASGVSKANDPRHAAKMFKAAEADKSGRWAAFHFTSHDNPYLSGEALQDITQDMSRESYLKEIMAEDDDAQVALLVYGSFNEKVCKIPAFPIPKHWLIYSGHDFGSANPAALFIAQDPATGYFYTFQEYAPGSGFSTAQNVETFKEIIKLPGQENEKNPKTYNVIRRSGGSHQEDEIRQLYAAHGWPITEPTINSVKAQVDKVKGILEKNKLFIFTNLLGLLAEINSCMWVLDDMGKPTNDIKDEKKYHLLACLRYILSTFTPETVPGGNRVRSTSHF